MKTKGALSHESNSPMPLSDAEVLKLARTAGAKEAILVDADVVTWKTSEMLDLFGQWPNAYKAPLFIRALDADSGEIDWNGKALSVDTFQDLPKGIHQLTCNALATGWGLRRQGITTNANICPQGQNVVVLNTISSPSKKEFVKSSPGTELGAQALTK